MLNGFSLTELWDYEFTGFFDGVPEKNFEKHTSFDLLTSIGNSQTAVDWTSSSRIDKAFGKSWSLRYLMYLLGQIHQPMHNIIRFSAAHPDGDNFGKLHKIKSPSYNNLFELFDDAFGQYPKLDYPLSSTTQLDDYVSKIITAFPKSQYTKEISNIDKSSWSKDSYNIGKTFAYTLSEGADVTRKLCKIYTIQYCPKNSTI